MLDAAADDPSLFIHRNEVAAAWRWIDPIIEAWQKPEHRPLPYAAGSWGRDVAQEFRLGTKRGGFIIMEQWEGGKPNGNEKLFGTAGGTLKGFAKKVLKS